MAACGSKGPADPHGCCPTEVTRVAGIPVGCVGDHKRSSWNVFERNHVGTDEWIALSRAMGAENSICINVGTATWDDAHYWIEYVNSPTVSYYAGLRAEYGHPEPSNVQYWHIGNESTASPGRRCIPRLRNVEYIAIHRARGPPDWDWSGWRAESGWASRVPLAHVQGQEEHPANRGSAVRALMRDVSLTGSPPSRTGVR
jgi:hypothetical protein